MLTLAISEARHVAEAVWGIVCGVTFVAVFISWFFTDMDEEAIGVLGGIVIVWAVVALLIY